MSRPKKVRASAALRDIQAYRKAQGVSQRAFWDPLGVTQSGGSRYEKERTMPRPVKILLVLYESGRITAADLEQVSAVIAASDA
jgi:transcriptional regulator with XRE-family HTH domain